MRNLTFGVIAAITLTFATAVGAAPVQGVATLAAPAVAANVTGADGVWRCTGTSCTGWTPATTGAAVAACSTVANANGRVAAFIIGDKSFAEAELKRCNRHVK